MKILHVCLANFYSKGYSYQENLLTKFHKKMGYEVCVLTSLWSWNKGKIIKLKSGNYIDENGVLVIRLKSNRNKPYSRLKKYNNLYKIIEEINPDIIFIHCPQFWDISIFSKYVKNHKNVELFVDNHSDYTNSASTYISKNILHKIIWKNRIKSIIPYVKKFYGVLPARVEFLKEMYDIPSEKCELLLMGGDDDLISKTSLKENLSNIKKQYSISDDDFVIVTGGKIDVYKKQTISLMKVICKIPKVKMIIFGSVDSLIREEFEKYVDGEKIKYIGWIDAKDSYDIFSISNLAVFPGRHSVFWEQVVSQGVPLIVKDLPDTHHIDIGGNVIFLKEDSENEIYDVIMKLLQNKSIYDEMKEAALSEKRYNFYYSEIAKKAINFNDK